MGAELSSIGASAPPSTPAPIGSTRLDSPRPGGSYYFGLGSAVILKCASQTR